MTWVSLGLWLCLAAAEPGPSATKSRAPTLLEQIEAALPKGWSLQLKGLGEGQLGLAEGPLGSGRGAVSLTRLEQLPALDPRALEHLRQALATKVEAVSSGDGPLGPALQGQLLGRPEQIRWWLIPGEPPHLLALVAPPEQMPRLEKQVLILAERLQKLRLKP